MAIAALTRTQVEENISRDEGVLRARISMSVKGAVTVTAAAVAAASSVADVTFRAISSKPEMSRLVVRPGRRACRSGS